jgi:hypothetical protein
MNAAKTGFLVNTDKYSLSILTNTAGAIVNIFAQTGLLVKLEGVAFRYSEYALDFVSF